jgi:hypothetical protein
MNDGEDMTTGLGGRMMNEESYGIVTYLDPVT